MTFDSVGIASIIEINPRLKVFLRHCLSPGKISHASSSVAMKRAGTYLAANISDDTKTVLAKLYVVEKAEGRTRKEFVHNLSLIGLGLSESQLDRWVANVNSTGSAISLSKHSGQPEALDREKRDIVSGWVLDQNDHGIPVHLSSYCDFVNTNFNIQITDMTASNYLRDDGFAYRILKTKGKSFVVDVERMRQGAWEWHQSHDFNKFNNSLDCLCSVDFTFTSHRTERASGYGPQGGAQPMVSSAISNYTNCILTCVWADGINRTPSMLFTYNQEFRLDRNPTERRNDQVEHLERCLNLYNIDADRVVYIGKYKGEKEHYARESPELARLFFEKYQEQIDLAAVTVLSDEGNSFFEEGESVFDQMGFNEHKTYKPDVHQYFSPNDNDLHGTGKGSWRSSRVDFSDDVDSSLRLLHYFDKDTITHSKHWFHRNILGLTESGVANLVAARGPKKSHLHKGWLRAYRVFMGEDARGLMPKLTDRLNDGLDGLYWEKK